MNHEDRSQAAIDELSQVVREQQRQSAALSAGLAVARQGSARQTSRAGRLGFGGVAALCVALLFSTAALAAIPGAGGVISGCYDKDTGKVSLGLYANQALIANTTQIKTLQQTLRQTVV